MPLCKALYNQVCVEISGKYRPCCEYPETSPYTVDDLTPLEFLNSDYIASIRKNMEGDSWDKGCLSCKKTEMLGMHSVRDSYSFYCQSDINVFDMLEIAVSNKCNSRCRMCDPKHSSLWKKTEDNLKTAGVVSYNIEKLLKSITGTQVNTIKYLGGEPLLTDEIENIFNFIKNHSDNKIKFYINTNLTVSPEKFETQLLNADEIFVGYSIDGTERVNEFIRDGCKWDSVVKNLEKWEDFFKNNNKKSMRYIHTVVQAYNFHNIEQLNNFSKEFNLEHNPVLIKDPVEFTLNSLPPEYIEKHKNNYNSSFIKDYKYNYKLNKMLVEKTKYQDLILKKSIDKYIPELSDVLKK